MSGVALRRVFWILSGILVGWMFLTPELWAAVSSRLCAGSIGCLVTDGVDLCLDSDKDGVACNHSDPNLTMNAPVPSGDEIVQGDLTVSGDLTVVGVLPTKRFLSERVGWQTPVNLGNASLAANLCFFMDQTGLTSSSCSTALVLGGAGAILDAQVLIKELQCVYNKSVAFDASDSITVKAAEVNGSAFNFFGSGLTVVAADPAVGVITETINTLTSFTANYGLTVGVTAKDDTTAGSELFEINCAILYEYP